jgi:hypothetical protein
MASQPVWGHLTGARLMLQFAEAETSDLDDLVHRLSTHEDIEHGKADVWRTYISWLVFGRQVAVSVDKGGRAAGRPTEFGRWWSDLAKDPVHAFFRNERNVALKEVGEVIVTHRVDAYPGRPFAFWAFPHGPHAGDPLVARCQQYNTWLYEHLLVPAQERLFEWTLAERRAEEDVALL